MPVLPDAWPEGNIRGLRARGGFTIDIAWKDGKMTQTTIVPDNSTDKLLRKYQDIEKSFRPNLSGFRNLIGFICQAAQHTEDKRHANEALQGR